MNNEVEKGVKFAFEEDCIVVNISYCHESEAKISFHYA